MDLAWFLPWPLVWRFPALASSGFRLQTWSEVLSRQCARGNGHATCGMSGADGRFRICIEVMCLRQISSRIICAADNFCGVGDREEITSAPKLSSHLIDSIDSNIDMDTDDTAFSWRHKSLLHMLHMKKTICWNPGHAWHTHTVTGARCGHFQRGATWCWCTGPSNTGHHSTTGCSSLQVAVLPHVSMSPHQNFLENPWNSQENTKASFLWIALQQNSVNTHCYLLWNTSWFMI